jgi:POT family proton-dependent oligopeptide transporter
VIAKFYIHMERKQKALSIPSRFATGILIASSAFYLLSTSHWFVTDGIVSSTWIVVSYFIISLGEILVSALGLALICKLAPPKLTTMFMGSFLLALAIGGWISGVIGHWIEVPAGVTDMQAMLEAYNHAFLNVGHMSLITGIIAVLLIPYISRLTGERQAH